MATKIRTKNTLLEESAADDGVVATKERHEKSAKSKPPCCQPKYGQIFWLWLIGVAMLVAVLLTAFFDLLGNSSDVVVASTAAVGNNGGENNATTTTTNVITPPNGFNNNATAATTSSSANNATTAATTTSAAPAAPLATTATPTSAPIVVPTTLVADAKFAVVSCYQPSTLLNTTVTVDLPGSKVVLVLTSYSKVNWWVNATLGTNVSAILASSYEKMTLLTPMDNVPVYKFAYGDLPYAIEVDNINFERLLKKLNAMFPSVKQVDAFYGQNMLESMVLVDTLIDPPTPEFTLEGHRPQPVEEDANFGLELLTEDLEVVAWTLNGPVEDAYATAYTSLAAFSNTSVYVFDENTVADRLRIVDRATKAERITEPMPVTFPTVSWPSALVIDTKRQLLSLVTFGGEGHVYRFNITAEAWLDVVALNNLDVTNVIYDESRDRYTAIEFYTANLLFVSNDWRSYDTLVASLTSRLAGFGRLYDAGNSPVPHLLLAQQDDDLGLIHVGPPNEFGEQVPFQVWHYNLATDQANLTYKEYPSFADSISEPSVAVPTTTDNEEYESPVVPVALTTDAKFSVVSCYEPSTLFNTTVTVDLPGSKVVLVLTSYSKVNWWVNATLGTNVSAILASSYEKMTLLTPMDNVPVYKFASGDLPMAYEVDNINFERLLKKLNAMFPSVKQVDAFHGQYTLEPMVIVDTLIDPPTPNLTLVGHRPQPVDEDVNFGFELLTEDLEVVTWTLNGPSKDTPTTAYYYTELATFSNTSVYVFDENTVADRLRIVDRATKAERITEPMPVTFPTISWPSALVIDTKRQILSLTAQSSVYRYNITAQSWLDVVTDLSWHSFTSVVYDQVGDRYVGIDSMSASIVYMSNDWQQYDVGTAALASRLPGFGRLYDAGNGPEPHLLLAQRDSDNLALIHVGGGMWGQFNGHTGGPVPVRVWYYNVATDQANLTYAAP